MAIHHFHCTDGADLIIDREGRVTAGLDEVYGAAREAAERLVRALPSYADWSNWMVCIYDELGQVDVVPFPERQRCAA